MMLHALGALGHPLHKRHRAHEVDERIGALDALADASPLREARECGLDLRVRHFLHGGNYIRRCMATPTTRLAPSPTGHLHLGHAFSFLCTWALARSEGWMVLLRLEDLDAGRTSDAAKDDALWALRWLGMDWDGAPRVQSESMVRYIGAMERLSHARRVFPAPHTRAHVRAVQPTEASAPNAGEAVLRFPPELRPPESAWGFTGRDQNHRFVCVPGRTTVHDQVCGAHSIDCSRVWGDPLVWMKSGVPSYQLAVVVDDAADGVTRVVRGGDLLDSAVLQAQLHRALGSAQPEWWHLPLVTDEHGVRLAKRHDSLSLRTLQQAGASPGRVRALVSHWVTGLPLQPALDIDGLKREVTVDRIRMLGARAPHLRMTADIVRWLCEPS